jgi:transposase
MGFLKVIRRWALREKMPIREIARRTGVSRNTIKKYLREGIVEPAFQAPDRPSKLDPYARHLTAWLTTELRKSRKERRTAKPMHADLLKLGYASRKERAMRHDPARSILRASGAARPSSSCCAA